MIIWITGLSGSGKTTIGKEVYKQWKKIAPNTVFVDNDDTRGIFDYETFKNTVLKDEEYTAEKRLMRAERFARFCQWLDKQEINAVCCTISNFKKVRTWNRKNYSKYFEIYLSVPIKILAERDTKGLYKLAMAGKKKNVLGVDIPYRPLKTYDLKIKNDQHIDDYKAIGQKILKKVKIL